ncbi:hypothetical protein R4369_29540 [Rhodococcus opacus]|nr:hypothetical protein [Rhodococcus opacus]MDV7088314.1 hypothetical protein [Rhodococcus opacus]
MLVATVTTTDPPVSSQEVLTDTAAGAETVAEVTVVTTERNDKLIEEAISTPETRTFASGARRA